jgi:hypothetical protein
MKKYTEDYLTRRIPELEQEYNELLDQLIESIINKIELMINEDKLSQQLFQLQQRKTLLRTRLNDITE